MILEFSAAALRGTLSKSLPLLLGERDFIFLNFQQMECKPSPRETCLLPQPAEKQVRVVAWRGWSFPRGQRPEQVPSGKPAPQKSPYESCLCKQAPESGLSLPL